MKGTSITILFDAQAEAAFNFYKSVFGGEFIHLQRMNEIPGAPAMSDDEGNKVLHVALPVGGSIISGMDIPAGRGSVNKGNNFMVSVDTSSEEETEQFFSGLAEGGTITMPIAHQFWGAYFGMVTDQFGIQWMLSYVK